MPTFIFKTTLTIMHRIKIDIISDVVCPWCIVGYKRLELAIKMLEIEDLVDIAWHPFEINPNMPKAGENLNEHIINKYGTNLEAFTQKKEMLTNYGAEHGFAFNFTESTKIYNTLELHVLLDYAKKFNKQTDLKLEFFNSYFTKNLDISNTEVIKNILTTVGLDANQAMATLNNTTAKQNIKDQENYWQQLGVSSVPTIVFNNTMALTGAQPTDTFKETLNSLIKKA